MQICASPGAFDNIAAGILLYLATDHWKGFLIKNKNLCRFLCVAGFGIVLATYLGTSQDIARDRVYASTLLDIGLFTFLLGGLQLTIFESKYWKPLGWPGKYCYGGYLLHPMVLSVIFPVIYRQGAWSSFALFVSATISVAALSYHFFEMPANRLIRKTFLIPSLKPFNDEQGNGLT
jgi:peptidoglycan/LPS O-acetylase OafA/YrhL